MGAKRPGTLYDELEVSRSASAEVIQAAYRSLVKRFHPDKNPGDAKAAERTRKVNDAYAVLSDADKRAAYDRELDDAATAQRDEPRRRERDEECAQAQRAAAEAEEQQRRYDEQQRQSYAEWERQQHAAQHAEWERQQHAARYSAWQQQQQRAAQAQSGGSAFLRIVGAVLSIGVAFIIRAAVSESCSSSSASASSTARASSTATETATATSTTPPRTLRRLTPIEWQRCLVASGYDIGPTGADGVWGPASQAAFDLWNLRHSDGTVNAEEIRRCWGEGDVATSRAAPTTRMAKPTGGTTTATDTTSPMGLAEPSTPPPRMTSGDRTTIDMACSKYQIQGDVSGFRQCKELQYAIAAQTTPVSLDGLPSDVRTTIELACSQPQMNGDLAAYRVCLRTKKAEAQ